MCRSTMNHNTSTSATKTPSVPIADAETGQAIFVVVARVVVAADRAFGTGMGAIFDAVDTAAVDASAA